MWCFFIYVNQNKNVDYMIKKLVDYKMYVKLKIKSWLYDKVLIIWNM